MKSLPNRNLNQQNYKPTLKNKNHNFSNFIKQQNLFQKEKRSSQLEYHFLASKENNAQFCKEPTKKYDIPHKKKNFLIQDGWDQNKVFNLIYGNEAYFSNFLVKENRTERKRDEEGSQDTARKCRTCVFECTCKAMLEILNSRSYVLAES